ncbi:MAG: PKD domain-containing protein [Actinomycetota bacterium]|nr:PKD domain-containing protein [Actinomycetota bacterium]
MVGKIRSPFLRFSIRALPFLVLLSLVAGLAFSPLPASAGGFAEEISNRTSLRHQASHPPSFLEEPGKQPGQQIGKSGRNGVNKKPKAVAEADKTMAEEGEAITFDASSSRDPDGEIVSWHWDFGDGEEFSGVKAVHAYRETGNYKVTLTVRDDRGATDKDTLRVKVVEASLNRPPVADAGSDLEVVIGEKAQLDGSKSNDPDGDPLSYTWNMVEKPEGSEASLDDPTSVNPAFIPDREGEYVIELKVSDGELESEPDYVTVTAVPLQLSNSIAPDDYQPIATYKSSYLAQNSAGKKLLYLEGDAFERGYAEGYLCPEGVYRMTHDYVDNFIKGLIKGFAGPLGALAEVPFFVQTVRRVMAQAVLSQEYAVPEEFCREMRGIAAGCQDRGFDVTYQDVFLINVGFDFLYSLVYQGGSLLCNEFSVFGEGTRDGRLYHGRDFMFTTGGDVFSDEALIMVHKPTEGFPLAASAAPGFVGFPTALNIQGVSFGMDMVPNRQNRALVSGMGCLLLCRQVVQYASDLQEGIEMVRNTSRGVSWLFMIADGKGPEAVVLETVADRLTPEGDDLFSTLLGILPGLSTLVAGVEETLPVRLMDGAGKLITGVGDLVEGTADVLPVLGDVHPDRGVAVRTADYVDPEGLEEYRIVIPLQDPLVPEREKTVISAFPLQRESEPGLVAMTNHYILPRMNLTQMGLFYHTIDTQQGGGRESEWRYDIMVDAILKYYGAIDRNTAMWLIDFLNPARCDYYGTDTTQSVKGHHVLMDNHSLEMWSLHGYYDDPWQHVDLKKILGLPQPHPPNAFPVAVIQASTTTAEVGEEIICDGSASHDPDGDIVSWHWDFGDGESATGKTVTHAYHSEGEYTVTLRVMDDRGASANDICRIVVGNKKAWSDEPPRNPYLADVYWSQSHRNSYCQASSPFPGPTDADIEYKRLPLIADTPIVLTFSSPYPDGRRVIWGSGVGFTGQIFKMDPDTFTFIDQYYPQVEEGKGLQLGSITGAYNILDRDGNFFVPVEDGINAFCDETPGNRFSKIKLKASFKIPDAELIRPGEEKVVGMTMTYDGMIAFVTNLGTVGVINRQLDPQSAHYISLNGEKGRDPNTTLEELEQVSNSIAACEKGGIYVVTDRKMYRVQWTGNELTLDPRKGAWSAEYDTDTGQQGGRLGKGSGTTPTLMGTGPGDRFVVIADGAKLMKAVLFWRDEIPKGWKPIAKGKDPRIAAEVPITFGDSSATESYTDQSPLVRGYEVVFVSNTLGSNIFDSIPPSLQPYTMLLSNIPGIAPRGIEKFRWNATKRKLERVWANPDISVPNCIPCMSSETNLIYVTGQRNGCWTLEAVDWDNGKSRFYYRIPISIFGIVNFGQDFLPFANSFYAATEIGLDGCVYTGTFGGVSRFRPR